MNLKQMRAAALKAAQDIIKTAKDDGDRDLTDTEQAEVEAKFAEIEELDKKIEAAEKSASLVARLTSVKEPLPEGAPDQKEPAGRSVAGRFVKSDAFKQFRESHPSGIGSGTPVRIEAKGLGSVRDLGIGLKADGPQGAEITTSTGYTGAAREPGYRNYLPVDEPTTFLDLITVGSTNMPYSEYTQFVSETDNAGVVPEGDLKPTSDITTEDKDSKAYTYADGFVVTNQQLADDGALVAFMDSRIRQHIRGVIEQKLFNGTGAGTEPEGIMTTSGTLSQVFDTDIVTTLARSLEKFGSNNGNASPQAIVMNPADIWALRMLKGTDGHYLLGNPLQQGPIPTPWGAPLVPSSKLDVGTALVGRFDSVQYLELEALNVLAFNQHKDFAQRNKTYVRAEARGRQVFYVPREVVVATIVDPMAT